MTLFAADVSGIDWMVRHGRSVALSIAMKAAPSKLCTNEYNSTILDMIIASATADRVSSRTHFASVCQTYIYSLFISQPNITWAYKSGEVTPGAAA